MRAEFFERGASMALYVPERHEQLSDARWSEGRALRAIDAIAADTHRAFDEAGLWPIHPFDRSPERPPDSLKPLYYGAAGVIWALYYLKREGAIELKRDYLPTLRTLIDRNRDDIRKHHGVRDYMERELGSYLLGETGLLLLEWKLAPSEDVARRLYDLVEARIGDARGIGWGGAGTMLAALFMHERTNDARWRDLFLRHFDALWNAMEYSDEVRAKLWTFELYGITEQRIGPLHGFIANVIPMLRGRHLLAADRQRELLPLVYDTIRATALIEGACANWPQNAGPTTRREPMPLLVQHCIGAPGIVNGVADSPPDPRWPLDELLLAAGELIWTAGPTTKMPVLCHGVPGSGYAFLKLFKRTCDDRWLDRARRFAMHAIDQAERAVAKYGQRKFSLWTGDLGLAIYLRDCIRGTAQFPTIDVF